VGFTSTTKMYDYIEIDYLTIIKEYAYSNTYYYVKFHFLDPKGISNYYRYSVAVNDQPFKFKSALRDKYNDGNTIIHGLNAGNINDVQQEIRFTFAGRLLQKMFINIGRIFNRPRKSNFQY